MFKLDDNLLRELGLGALPAQEKNRMLQHIYETLEMRVGMKLAEQMTNEQLDEFEAFIERNDEAGALKWLETNFPNYKQVVADELEKLKTEIKAAAPQILAASQQMAQAMPQAVYPAPQPQAQMPYAQSAAAPVEPQSDPQQYQYPPQGTVAAPSQYPQPPQVPPTNSTSPASDNQQYPTAA